LIIPCVHIYTSFLCLLLGSRRNSNGGYGTRAQLHNQGFSLSVNRYNCSPNFEWLTVLFKQIQMMFM